MPTDDARHQHAWEARQAPHARGAQDDAAASVRQAPRTRRAQAGAIALSMLLCARTLAQSAAPAEAAPAEASPVEAPSTVAPVEASSVPTPAQVARTALDTDLSTINELRQLQRRENEAWTVRSETSLAWPAVGLGVGSLLTPILVPLGATLLANADDFASPSDAEIDGYDPDRRRRAGAVLLPLGLTAVATVIYCSILVHRRRHAKRSANQELRTVREHRTRILSAFTPPEDASGAPAN